MAELLPALRRTLGKEGVALDAAGKPIPGRTGYVNHPSDPGGETNYGIIASEARRYGYTGPMRDLPFETVVWIYTANYWKRLGCDAITDQAIAEELFDAAVNCGAGTAGRWLQVALNAFNRRGERYPDVAEDGMVGAGTLASLSAALAVAPWYASILLEAMVCQRGTYYLGISRKNPKLEDFTPGWFRTRVGLE